jgi:hypothetical protein
MHHELDTDEFHARFVHSSGIDEQRCHTQQHNHAYRLLHSQHIAQPNTVQLVQHSGPRRNSIHHNGGVLVVADTAVVVDIDQEVVDTDLGVVDIVLVVAVDTVLVVVGTDLGEVVGTVQEDPVVDTGLVVVVDTGLVVVGEQDNSQVLDQAVVALVVLLLALAVLLALEDPGLLLVLTVLTVVVAVALPEVCLKQPEEAADLILHSYDID